MIKANFKTVNTKDGKGIKIKNLEVEGDIFDVLNDLVNVAALFATQIAEDFLKSKGLNKEEVEEMLFQVKMNLLVGLSDGHIGEINLNEFMEEIKEEMKEEEK